MEEGWEKATVENLARPSSRLGSHNGMWNAEAVVGNKMFCALVTDDRLQNYAGWSSSLPIDSFAPYGERRWRGATH